MVIVVLGGNMVVKTKKIRGGLSMKISEFHASKESWTQVPRSKWNVVTFVSHFCIKYEKLYSTNYIFSGWKGNPALTKEGRDFSKILKSFQEEGLSKEDSKTKLYNYINWAFDYKGSRGTNINSTGLLTNNVFRNHFEKMYTSFLNKRNSKTGISTLASWCKENNPDILDLYDLNTEKDIIFIKKMVDDFGLSNGPEFDLIEKAKSMGLI